MKIHAKDGHSGTYIHISVSDPEGDAAIMARILGGK